MTIAITRPQARLELALLQAEADMITSSDLYIRLTHLGLTSEIAIRLKGLLGEVQLIGNKLFNIGKILVLKFIDFIEHHPNLATGVALAAVVSLLIASIPFLGPILAAFILPLGLTVGAIAGHRVDKAHGKKINDDLGVISIAQDVIDIARVFFQFFIDILRALSDEIII